MNNDYPILDGIAPSWADIIVRVSATGAPLLEMKDIASIDTGTTVEVGNQIGASGGRVMRRTTGSVKNESGASLYRSGFQKFLRNLKVAAEAAGHVRGNQVLVSLVHFDIQVQHTPINDVEIYEYIIKGCRYFGRTLNSAEGNDADQVGLNLNPLEIADIIDGKEIVCL